ncbi:hypothetical protein [Spirosoma sp.]|uniref:hypothetical protein n=1 Tax=Spirosoma sp. TaxID=1899569 RepID=UPI003B3A7DE3
MAQYQLVEKHAIQQHNEYYELRTTQDTDHPKSLYFITNEENLEDVAATIVAEHLSKVQHWTIIPHRKGS